MTGSRTRTSHRHVVLLCVALLVAPEAPVIALNVALGAVAVGLFAGRVKHEGDQLVACRPLEPGDAVSTLRHETTPPPSL